MLTLRKIFIFLCLATGGFCCNSGWSSFNGKCYKASQRILSDRLSENFCQAMKAHLAIVNSPELLQFLNTIPDFNGAYEYLVHGSSSLSQAKTSTPSIPTEQSASSSASRTTRSVICSYIKELKIDRKICREKNFFICESSIPDTLNNCPPGFDFYGTNCFRAVSSVTATYEDAQKFCRMQNSKLAILETTDELMEALAPILPTNETFLVGAKEVDGVLKWDNGVPFYTISGSFHSFRDGECLGVFKHPNAWAMILASIELNCDDKHNFLCEIEADDLVNISLTSTETTLAPLECPLGSNWKSHDISGYCFWETAYETERLNWFQARNFCKLYGGDLASYDSSEQEKIGLGEAYGYHSGLWLGLQRDENSVFHWVDGSTMNYTNWATNEPNLWSKSKFCVTHSNFDSQWTLDYCGVRRGFVCKAPKARNPVVPELPSPQNTRCNIPSTSVYHSQWREFEEHCYLIMDSARYTWDTARYFCQDNGAHMASIHSFGETNFLLGSMSTDTDSNYWIGLSSHGLHSSYEWTDNTLLDFIYWTDNKTEPKDFNVCIHFNQIDGAWDVDNCNRIQGVICKRGINATYDFTSPEPTTVMPGNCENEWYNSVTGNKCYNIFGKLWSQRVTWAQAKLECEAMGATLVSIHNRDEQDFLIDVVLEAHTDVWIGLRAIERGTVFHWSDDSRMDFTNWDANKPGFQSETSEFPYKPVELCVQMEHAENRMGKWNDISCDEKRAYVCQKYKAVSQKLTAGGIFGIIICFLVILTIIGVTWYYLKRKNNYSQNQWRLMICKY